MDRLPRRDFLRRSASLLGAASAAALIPQSIRRAMAIPANVQTGTLQDVHHIVVLMLENRSFDHYFGTMQGVRGFGDPFPINGPSGTPVWNQSNGTTVIPPYHMNSATTSALLVPSGPHSWFDMQAAWNQGAFGQWPLYKNATSMGYYHQTDLPFHFALAQAFTLCDNYYCSVTGGTEPNRVWFMSGSCFNPALAATGTNCTNADAIVNNGLCEYSQILPAPAPAPGYVFSSSSIPFSAWLTLPEVLQNAGVSWRIYQATNDNGGGSFYGCLAFSSFRQATSATGGPLYTYGMTSRSIAQLQQDVINNSLPQVSWILPQGGNSEHPSQSSPVDGAYFISQVLDAITANPAVWAQTALLVTYDENDGFFDHLPAPAVPSFNANGTLAGAATLPLAGEYFNSYSTWLDPSDTISGPIRPYGMGPRVPMFVISPWSRGGWVNSEVFDHTSIALLLERRFGITVSAISPWRRAVSGDLTSAFDFTSPNDSALPTLPNVSNYHVIDQAQAALPPPNPPATPQPLYQAPGVRPSRALPYTLAVGAEIVGATVTLSFVNAGAQGVVFHVYDQLNLGNIPRRYTVEAGKSLTDTWAAAAGSGAYKLWVYGPNGFVRFFQGNAPAWSASAFQPEIQVAYEPQASRLSLGIVNGGTASGTIDVTSNKYSTAGNGSYRVPANGSIVVTLDLVQSLNWYDYTIAGGTLGAATFERRLAGRMETGKHGVTDPAMGLALQA